MWDAIEFNQLISIILCTMCIFLTTHCGKYVFSYHFHVMTEENLVYICMTDERIGKRLPYMFLEEVHSNLVNMQNQLSRAQISSSQFANCN